MNEETATPGEWKPFERASKLGASASYQIDENKKWNLRLLTGKYLVQQQFCARTEEWELPVCFNKVEKDMKQMIEADREGRQLTK